MLNANLASQSQALFQHQMSLGQASFQQNMNPAPSQYVQTIQPQFNMATSPCQPNQVPNFLNGFGLNASPQLQYLLNAQRNLMLGQQCMGLQQPQSIQQSLGLQGGFLNQAQNTSGFPHAFGQSLHDYSQLYPQPWQGLNYLHQIPPNLLPFISNQFNKSSEEEGEIVTEKDGLQEKQTFHGVSKSKHIPNTVYYKILRYKHQDTKRVRRIMQCTYQNCGKLFRKRCNFFDHLRIHTQEKPFACTVAGCSKSFSQSANLQKHLDLHYGPRKYICEECPKRFTAQSSLMAHKRFHQTDYPRKISTALSDSHEDNEDGEYNEPILILLPKLSQLGYAGQQAPEPLPIVKDLDGAKEAC